MQTKRLLSGINKNNLEEFNTTYKFALFKINLNKNEGKNIISAVKFLLNAAYKCSIIRTNGYH